MPSVARSVATAAAPSQVSAAGPWPPWWRQGWKWSDIADDLEPDPLGLPRELEQLDRAELLGRRLVAEPSRGDRQLEAAPDPVERVALRGRAARRVRRPDQVRRLELHAVVGARRAG